MMGGLRRFIGGLKALIHRAPVDRELGEELQAYLDASIDEKVRSGVALEDARRAARVELGSIEAVKDHTRDAGWEAAADRVWRDVRYAARTLRRSPAFAAVVVSTLTLGIGANTTIFSAVNAIMLRDLPAERPDELVALTALHPDGSEPFSYAAYRRIAADGAPLVDVLAASTSRREAVTIDGPPETVELKWVSGNYFGVLGVRTSMGRPLTPSDDLQPPGAAVAVISDAFWSRRFGRDPDVCGRSFRVKGTVFVVVGVAVQRFTSETPGESVDVWMPLSARPDAPSWVWNGHSTTWLSLLARRRAGIGIAQARAGLQPVYERVREDVAAGTDGAEFRRSVLESRLIVSEASGGASRIRDNLATPLMILTCVVALVLLVACANVANLMLTRAVTRRRETALRLALGAGRLRLVRQGLAEALLLALCGGVGGTLVAIWGTETLSSLLAGVLPVVLEIGPDTRVLVFAATLSCATALLFGLLPTLWATRLDPAGVVKGGGDGGRTTSRIPLGRSLVVAQIAMSLVLLVASGLFVRSLVKLEDVDLGFDPGQVVLVRVSLLGEQQSIQPGTRRLLYRQFLDGALKVPGVDGASAASSGLLSSDTWRNVIAIEGVLPPSGRPMRTFVNAVTPGYFDVMRIPVLRGRGFNDRDREQTLDVAIVNDTFVRQFLGGIDPIGARVGLCRSESCTPSGTSLMEIVGVAGNVKHASLRDAAPPLLYVPFTQVEQNLREIQIRTTGDASSMVPTLYKALADIDRRLAIVGMLTARDRVGESLASQSMMARASLAFGLLALVLAAVGLSGLVAYMTTQRRQEIGVRMALGASRGDVRRLVLGGTVRLVAIGAGLGMPLALAGAVLLSGLLYQMEPYDPLVLSLSIGVLALAALIAGYLPAQRAARVDPVETLRAE